MISIDVELTGIETLKPKQINDAFTAAFRAVGEKWWDDYLPKRFDDRGQRRYGFKRRSGQLFNSKPIAGSYTAVKLRKYGHTRPLVFTGGTAHEAITTKRIAATRKMVRVSLPRGYNRRNPSSDIKMADEVRAVRPDEIKHLSSLFVSTLESALQLAGARSARAQTTTFGGDGRALFARGARRGQIRLAS